MKDKEEQREEKGREGRERQQNRKGEGDREKINAKGALKKDTQTG